MSKKLRNHTIVIFENEGNFGIISIDKHPKHKTIVSRYNPCNEKEPVFKYATESLNDGLNLMADAVWNTESKGWTAVYTGGRNWG